MFIYGVAIYTEPLEKGTYDPIKLPNRLLFKLLVLVFLPSQGEITVNFAQPPPSLSPWLLDSVTVSCLDRAMSLSLNKEFFIILNSELR